MHLFIQKGSLAICFILDEDIIQRQTTSSMLFLGIFLFQNCNEVVFVKLKIAFIQQ